MFVFTFPRNFPALVAVSLLSTERYSSLTLTRAPLRFLPACEVDKFYSQGSLYTFTHPKMLFASKLPLTHHILVFFFCLNVSVSVLSCPLAAVQPGNLLFLNFLLGSGESTSEECISHKLNSTIAEACPFRGDVLEQTVFHLSRRLWRLALPDSRHTLTHTLSHTHSHRGSPLVEKCKCS